MYQFVRAAITTYHRLDDLTETCFLTVLHVQDEGVGGSASPEVWLQMRLLSAPSLVFLFLSARVSWLSVCPDLFL